MSDVRDWIVVGFDGSEHAYAALRWAIDEARRHDAGVRVVHVWSYGIASASPYTGDVVETLRDAAQLVLDDAAKVVDEAGVPYETRLEFGSAAPALVLDAEDAVLLVVGSRSHGGLTGAILGSVANACVHHAPCPVVVVPDGRARAEGVRPVRPVATAVPSRPERLLTLVGPGRDEHPAPPG